jgi:hypothetical protein
MRKQRVSLRLKVKLRKKMLLEELDFDSICKRKPLKISPDWSQQTGKKKRAAHATIQKCIFFSSFFFIRSSREREMWELSLWRIATSWRFREREKVTRPVHLDISGELKKQNQKQLKFFSNS